MKVDFITCCDAFNNKISDAGNRGLAFLAGNAGGKAMFIMQSRGVSFEDEACVGDLSFILNVASEIPIAFCPFCGSRLVDLIAQQHDAFRDLGITHHKFLGHFRASREPV